MPFKSLKQELFMRKNNPSLWKEWVRKYGHAPGYTTFVKKTAQKSAQSRRRKRR